MALSSIVIGWGRWTGLLAVSADVAAESARRLGICEKCEFATSSSFLEFIGNQAYSVKGKYCSKCGCPCHQKSLTDDKCPEGFWNN
jgi:hypothetical protein